MTHAASAIDRKLLGSANEYLSAEQTQRYILLSSQRARRQAAWRVIERVVTPIEVFADGQSVPAFRTWNDRDDLKRVFDHLYQQLSAEERSARVAFAPADITAGFAWNPTAVDELEAWPAERQLEYQNDLTQGARRAGVGGIRRIALSPAASQHVIASYGPSIDCLATEHPPTNGGPTDVVTLLSTTLRLAECQTQQFGPYPVAAGNSLVARVAEGSAIKFQVRYAGGEPAPQECTETECTARGPGMFWLAATSDQTLDTELTVEEHQVAGRAPDCLAGWFPAGSASVAEEWRRADASLPFPAYDTTASSLLEKLNPNGDASWGAGDRVVDPDADAIYTVSTAADTRFRLAGMHIRAREAGTWLYITMWWSDTPDADFGEDRPSSLEERDGPWRNYKMCVSVDFNELDPDPEGGFGTEAPSLGAALRALRESETPPSGGDVHAEAGPSWCSNPYIDGARYLVRSNCVGCHQNAMSGATPAETVNDEMRFPSFGRLRVRDDLPADGFWGLDAGDELAQMFANTVDWWKSGQP